MSEDSYKDQIVRSTTDGLSKRSSGRLVRRGLQDLAGRVPNDRKRILVADDQEAINEVMGEILKAAGYEVKQTTHPAEVLALAEEFRPQVALISLIAPEIDGIELSLSLSKSFPQIKIVLTCETVEEGILRHLFDNGVACDTFEAPFERADLLGRMTAWANGLDFIDPATRLRGDKAFQSAVRNILFFRGPSASILFMEVSQFAASQPTLNDEGVFLRQLGATLSRFAHDGFAYRREPSQFAMLLPHVSKEQASEMSKQLNIEIRSLLKKHELDRLFFVVIDVIALPDVFQSVEHVVVEAERQLALAKIVDFSTGLYKFRHFDFILDTELYRSGRYNYEFGLLFFEIDQFKYLASSLSDVALHNLLAEFGEVAKTLMRRVDFGFYWREGSFALVLPQISKENACIIARRLRELIRETTWLAEDEGGLRVTASIGVATYPTDAKTKIDLIHAAEEALFHVKNFTGDGAAAANVGLLAPLK